MGRIERSRVSVEREAQSSKVFDRCALLWLPDSHVLWAQFRHRLSHWSHGFRESCHRCVHRGTRRLWTSFNRLCSELTELTSQHLNFLSRCHHHSILQYQDKLLRYHARVGNNTKRVQERCAQWMMRAISRDPTWAKTSECEMDVTVVSTDVHGLNKHNGNKPHCRSEQT